MSSCDLSGNGQIISVGDIAALNDSIGTVTIYKRYNIGDWRNMNIIYNTQIVDSPTYEFGYSVSLSEYGNTISIGHTQVINSGRSS